MKKIVKMFAVILCFTLVFGLAACSNKSNNQEDISGDDTNPQDTNQTDTITGTTYVFAKLFGRIEGFADQEIPASDPDFDACKELYGDTIKLYPDKIEFNGEATAPFNSVAFYNKNENNITFADSILSAYCAILDGDKFNLIINVSEGAAIIMEFAAQG